MPRIYAILFFGFLFLIPNFHLHAQTEQKGADRNARSRQKLAVEYVHYRPGKWEQEKVQEFESEHPYEGGMVYVYLRNTSEEPLNLAFWRVNNQDESYWRLNYFTVWDRTYSENLAPGELTVLELNGRSADFAEGKDFRFSYVDRSWGPAGSYDGALDVDPVQIAYLHVAEGLGEVVAHVRYTGDKPIRFTDFEIEGLEIASVEWAVGELSESGNTIARIKLANPLPLGGVFYAKLGIKIAGEKERTVMAHRRAHADFFPIGLWNDNEERWEFYYKHHMDTMVHNGPSTSKFMTEAVPKYGFNAMVHTDIPRGIDRINDMKDNAGVACWMIADEPDWSTPPNIMLFEDNAIRHYDTGTPTFITLCRNTQFPAFGAIADIPCQDHYSVTAPSSSKWPRAYGTRLEETGYYTRDLKYVAEPKPIWIWTQGIADWGQRPRRPVPTPDELAVQLLQNLGRGAKGILWFNWDTGMHERFPDAMAAVQSWNRVMKLLRPELLSGDIVDVAEHVPEAVDVAAVASWDMLVLFLTNMDYEIDPEAYPFQTVKDLNLDIQLPGWIKPGNVLHIDPENGISPLVFTQKNGRLHIEAGNLEAAEVVVITNAGDAAANMQAAFEEIKRIE